MGNKHKLAELAHDNGAAPHAAATHEAPPGPTPLEAERSMLRAAAATLPGGMAPPPGAPRRDSELRSKLLRK